MHSYKNRLRIGEKFWLRKQLIFADSSTGAADFFMLQENPSSTSCSLFAIGAFLSSSCISPTQTFPAQLLLRNKSENSSSKGKGRLHVEVQQTTKLAMNCGMKNVGLVVRGSKRRPRQRASGTQAVRQLHKLNSLSLYQI